ncbi:hypothetical protein [Streptomyces sp. NBC_01750]|uniref:hypothetical protein n=1 Tax=Streptomyces sp. NBC_01750 TaxID=2975928 RepID=UPI002DDC1505|nr:hypothetical protein [Streptomyces sp. NBC_01750]WSD38095.1 hypothetical protein OG966_40305 [Streptomyces sp. NBC_01750]
MAELSHARGLLPERKFRLAQFFSRQQLDPQTGRVVGRWGTGQVDGGLALAERYACVHEIGEDRYWDDLKGLYRLGFAEQVVKPAPGRRAVYALCLRADAIPSDLPEDLMRELRVWDLPEAEEPFEDAAYGRLTTRPAPDVEPMMVRGKNPETQRMLDELAAAPRWEHPAGSKAALVAGTIREGSKRLGDAAPDLRCTAVADRDRAAEMTARVHRLMALGVSGKPSPLYAKGFSQLVGFTSNGSSGLNPSYEMEKTKRTPSAAPGKEVGQAFGDALSDIASSVQRRVWHSWRTQFGRGRVFLSAPTPEEQSRSHTGSPWTDLHHTIVIALRRGGTESQLVEMLTSNLIRRDEWGLVTFEADNLGRLAGYRLWKFINSQKNAHGYGRRCHVPQAAHVTAWDEATSAERDRARARAGQVREIERRREMARIEAAAAQRAERHERWNLSRYATEPEHVHQQQLEERHRIERPAPRTADSTHAAALAKARAEKRARKGLGPR